jgi:glycosyltransferase involved in cell wall biosynthesis
MAAFTHLGDEMADWKNMHIGFNNPDSKVDTGFGHATFKILTTMAKLGYPVVMNRKASIQVAFCHPNYYRFFDIPSYKVGYTAWESTEMQPGWQSYLESIDELWVPNTFCKNVFSKHVEIPIRVFHHGVSSNFYPQKRKLNDKFIFLHMGFPAVRKNLPDTVNAFLENYAGRKDVELWIKGYDTSTIFTTEKNIKLISGHLPYDDIISMFHNAHALAYPSWGEGFGLIPLQAMATGLPTIITDGWADYQNLTDLIVSSNLSESPWQNIHPGKMFKPKFSSLVSRMDEVLKDYEKYSTDAFNKTDYIHQEWSWNTKVEQHFEEFLQDLYKRKIDEVLTSAIPLV